MKHFIITRFNINFRSNRTPLVRARPEWFDYRLYIFNKICYPSIINQINKNFEYICLCSEEYTDKKKMSGFKDITILYCPEEIVFTEILRKYIKTKVDKDELLLTTRLDSDDALNKNFVGLIQNNIQPEDSVIQPSAGIIVSLKKKSARLKSYSRVPSMYCTVQEKITDVNDIKTVYRCGYGYLRHLYPLINISTNYPVWMRVIYDVNLSNQFCGSPVTYIPAKEDFGTDVSLLF
jgi:hypothetical protein